MFETLKLKFFSLYNNEQRPNNREFSILHIL